MGEIMSLMYILLAILLTIFVFTFFARIMSTILTIIALPFFIIAYLINPHWLGMQLLKMTDKAIVSNKKSIEKTNRFLKSCSPVFKKSILKRKQKLMEQKKKLTKTRKNILVKLK